MSRVYTQQDYEGGVDDNYRRYPFFETRAGELDQRWNAIKGAKILIAGCGWGFLVDELMSHGFTDVWGCDASDHAVTTAAPREIPDRASRIVMGDITSDQSIRSVASAAGIPGGNPRFRVIVTEDVLPCLTLGEMDQALTVLRARSHALAHFITPMYPDGTKQPDGSVTTPWGGVQMAGFTWLTRQEWIDLIGPGEPIVFAGETEAVNL